MAVRFQIIDNARIENLGKSQSCMVGGELAGNSGLALREMEDTLVQRDGAVMGQARRTMGLKTALSDALGCAHHALWQSENHLTLTHVDASPAELMVYIYARIKYTCQYQSCMVVQHA